MRLLKNVTGPMGRTVLMALAFTGLLYSGAAALEVIDVPLNQTITVHTSSSPLDQASTPQKLWMKYGKGYSPKFYVRVYRFMVKPGEKYTFYGYYPADGIYRNLYLLGENPLTDYTASYGDTTGFLTGFVMWAQQPGKWQCPAVTRRVNFTIAPKSEHQHLYVIATSQTPRQSLQMLLKTPADPDSEVEKSTADPSCLPKKGQTWGQIWEDPLLLRLDPSEKDQTAATLKDPLNPFEVVDLPLNQIVSAQTSSVAVVQSQSPKKLWEKYGKGYAPNFYTRIYRFAVFPGQKYTLYGYFPPDGIYRNFYVLGETPLTDTTWSYGDTRGVSTGFVFWGQQPGKWSCPSVTRRINFTISPKSQHNHLYLIATSQKPLQGFQVMLKGPADPDYEVEKPTADPSCPPKKGQTWGQVWGNPILLRYDPNEKGR